MTPASQTAESARVRSRREWWYLAVLVPSILAAAWFLDWRDRIDQTRLPVMHRAGRLFSEANSVLHRAAELDAHRRPDSTRVVLASRLVSLLLTAGQLHDIDRAIRLNEDRLRRVVLESRGGAAPESIGLDSDEAWVYDNLLVGRGRADFVPAGTPGADELRAWTRRRDQARQGKVDRSVPLPVVSDPPGADSTLRPVDAVQVAIAREAALAEGLRGDPFQALSLLESVQEPYAGRHKFNAPSVIQERAWPLRLLRYPDLDLPGDLARLLEQSVPRFADSLWLSFIPSTETFEEEYGEAYDAAPLEACLRWHLACAAAARSDTAWFRTHAGALSTGTFLYHHWTRLLAAAAAGVDLPEPALSKAREIEAQDAGALRLLDRLALAEPLGLTTAPEDLPSALQVRERLDHIFKEYLSADNYYADYFPPARGIALIYGGSEYGEYVVGQWLDLAPRVPQSDLRAQDRWRYLLRARIRAARALGILAVQAGKEIPRASGLFAELEITTESVLPWNTGMGRQANVSLVDYVPGLLSVSHVLKILCQGEDSNAVVSG
ncbi:MAG: hypothetical protein KBD56_01495 [Candidatus Eisenbacteria bacterium]|nr:hypothetical protein [Candidatus Eisenbacteria bacterium]